jgi:hypothetical protein
MSWSETYPGGLYKPTQLWVPQLFLKIIHLLGTSFLEFFPTTLKGEQPCSHLVATLNIIITANLIYFYIQNSELQTARDYWNVAANPVRKLYRQESA